jgi:hypothetical protein
VDIQPNGVVVEAQELAVDQRQGVQVRHIPWHIPGCGGGPASVLLLLEVEPDAVSGAVRRVEVEGRVVRDYGGQVLRLPEGLNLNGTLGI